MTNRRIAKQHEIRGEIKKGHNLKKVPVDSNYNSYHPPPSVNQDLAIIVRIKISQESAAIITIEIKLAEHW